MKKATTCLILLAITLASQSTHSQELPARSAVLETALRTNTYFMQKWPNPGQIINAPKRDYPSHIWTRAVYYEGLMALHQIHPQPEFYNYAVDWGTFHQWKLRKGTATRDADNQCAGQTYLQLYEIDPQPERIHDIEAGMAMLLENPDHSDWSWIDAIQMAMPIFAKLGVKHDDPRYFEKMYNMYHHTKYIHGKNGLYNPEDGLWWRDAKFVPPYTEPNGEDCYWSRGNGWVVAALVRVLEIIPADEPHRAEYEADLLAMLAAVKKVQRPDGFWNVSLHDPDHFGGKETTGTALFVYGMAWAINNHLVQPEEYLPSLTKAWNAMATESVHQNGFLGYVQGTGKEPKDGQPVTYDREPDFDDYGLGCFLLAATEVYKLAPER